MYKAQLNQALWEKSICLQVGLRWYHNTASYFIPLKAPQYRINYTSSNGRNNIDYSLNYILQLFHYNLRDYETSVQMCTFQSATIILRGTGFSKVAVVLLRYGPNIKPILNNRKFFICSCVCS